MSPRATYRISSWAQAAMRPESWNLADHHRMIVVGASPSGPWTVRHWRLVESLEGQDVDALVERAVKEIAGAS